MERTSGRTGKDARPLGGFARVLWAACLAGLFALGGWAPPALGADWKEHQAAGIRAFDQGDHSKAIQQLEAAVYYGRRQTAPQEDLGLLLEDLTTAYLVGERYQRARNAIDRWDAILAANSTETWAPKQQQIRDQLSAYVFEAVRHENGTPPPLPVRAPDRKQQAAVPVPTATGATPAATAAVPAATAGSFAIHLVSMRTLESANTAWATLQERYPELLADKTLVTREIDLVDKGHFVRVLAAPYPDAARAREACDELEPQDQYCAVMSIE